VSTETYGAALDCPSGTLSPGFSGTSASAPHAAGALALLFQRTGASFTTEACREILERRAVPLPGSSSSDARCGRGALCLRADGCP
jgi:subtilisin family serine protease